MPPATDIPTIERRPREEGAGPIIGAIIIVVLMIFGALYFWGQKLNKRPASDTPLVQSTVSID